MVALHLVLVLERLARTGETGQRLARALTEAFVGDLDHKHREMSVGDLAVPKEVNRAIGALHERYNGYRTALADADEAPLTVAIQSRLAGVDGGQGLDARQICAYLRRARHRLDLEPTAEVLAGRIAWPHVDAAELEAAGSGAEARG
jgi:hypothetical protein